MSTCAAVLAVTLAFPLSATASPGPALDDAVSAALNSELAEIAAASDGTVSFSDVSVDVSSELVQAAGSSDPAAIADFIVDEAERTQRTQAPPVSSLARAASPQSVSAVSTTVNYTADQNTTLPSFGVAWVNQDMSVTFTGNTINSVRLKGNSYGTGISIFAYSHINTTLEYRKSRTCLYTHMKGTFSAIVKGSAVNFAATVLATDAPRGGRMVSLLYSDC